MSINATITQILIAVLSTIIDINVIPKEMIGSEMGQFHSDYSCPGTDHKCKYGIIVGKKCYYLKMESVEGTRQL
jgi:hypothetical protein